MRINLTKKYYTRAERVFGRLCQESGVPFRSKVKLGGREVDFVIGKYAIEIDGHPQSVAKNDWLVAEGYVPVHFTNGEIINNRNIVKELIRKYGYISI